jgi:hypothetical protein
VNRQEDKVRVNNKLEMVKWLANSDELGLTLGLTVMPKKVFYKYVPKSRYAMDGKVYRHLTKVELEKANERLVHTLNKVVYKNAYVRNGKKLLVIGVIEGDNNSTIDLHTHYLLEKPSSYTFEEFSKKVHQALELSGDFETTNPNYKFDKDSKDDMYRFKFEPVDTGWSGYITKKLDKLDLNNLYFY